MKRLHIVGKSKDNKRLYLARSKGARFGSYEIPIGQKLLKLIREVEDAREARRRPPTPAGVEDVAGVRVLPREPEPEGGANRVPASEREEEADAEAEDVAGGETAPSRVAPVAGLAGKEKPGPLPPEASQQQEEEEAPPTRHAGLPSSEVREERGGGRRAKRPEVPERSNLSPAEIQGLIRAGLSIRTVAKRAGTSAAWIRWLAEPIQQERMGVVAQMLRERQERSRLGLSALPIGDAVLENLRGRGVSAPETVLEEGFTALRPDGREWRVRLSFDHRGRRWTAQWSYDPQAREVEPLNRLATNLGWRRAEPEEDALPPPRRRSASRRTPSRKRSPSRTSRTRRS